MKVPAMRLTLSVWLLAGMAVIALGAWAAEVGGTGDAKSFYEAHDWFSLRDAVAGKDATALYRGAVDAAFNRQEEAEQALRPLAESTDDSKEADDANEWLSYLYIRNGKYQKAAAEMAEGSALLPMLKTSPDQLVQQWQPSSIPSRIRQHKVFIPVVLEGKITEFFIDSDANFSFVSETRARSLGFAVRDSGVKVHGAGGMQAGFRIAVASELAIGKVILKNVLFLVMPDEEEVFSRGGAAEGGALGLPVLMALRRVVLSQNKIEIGGSSEKTQPGSGNLCFDGLDPVVKVEFQQQGLPAILDTGAEATEVWPPFAARFPAVVNASRRTGSSVERSFGGRTRVPEKTLPELTLRLGGFDARLGPAHVLLAPTTPNSARYYARIGADTLEQARQITIDFEALTFSVQ